MSQLFQFIFSSQVAGAHTRTLGLQHEPSFQRHPLLFFNVLSSFLQQPPDLFGSIQILMKAESYRIELVINACHPSLAVEKDSRVMSPLTSFRSMGQTM
jgi:hypothetical protein